MKVFSILVLFVASTSAFIHPGILHNKSDLERIKSKVASSSSPWIQGYNKMKADSHSSSSYVMQGPDAIVERGNPNNPGNGHFSNDAIAAYYNAIMYYITGDPAHAVIATTILNAWASTLVQITGQDAQLAASLYGFQMVNAAEIIRYEYSGWGSDDIVKFEGMIRNILYPIVVDQSGNLFLANWGTGCIKSIMAFGIFLDDDVMFKNGLNLYSISKCASLNASLNDFGQSGESGRDQAHTQLGLGHESESCQIAWNQGIDIWSLLSNRLLTGYEYTAKYNLGNLVQYDPNFYRCGANLVGGPWKVISDLDRGQFRPIYEIAYAHYVALNGLSMPFTKQVLDKVSPEGANPPNSIADNAAYGTLLFHLV